METACRIKRPLEDFEHFNQDQLERLQVRLKGTEEEKWKKMYHILFPDDDTELAPSPCKWISTSLTVPKRTGPLFKFKANSFRLRRL